MAKRPDNSESVLLALELMRRIPRNGKVTADQLHRQLKDAGISRDLRSIQRQLAALSQHFGIERDDRDKPYGYRWLPNSEGLALPHLSPQESLLLRLAEQHLSNLLPARLMHSMDGFFAQARRNLGENANAKLEREWPDKVRVVATSQPLLPPKIADGVLEAASEALYANHWLHVEYVNAGGKQVSADVMPLGLAQQGARLYLVCRFKDYDDDRNLALHRIRAATVSTLGFNRPRGFDLARYDADGKFGFGEGRRIRLSFSVEAGAGTHLRETPLSADQTIKQQKDGSLRVTATVGDSMLLEQWLRGFGDDVWNVRKQRIAGEAHGKDVARNG
ncbi:MAG: WYL domain-containing protein [Proteobacteria bacterium]|nr:WYL domain-containing protein [Pseudomonadota bacterium]